MADSPSTSSPSQKVLASSDTPPTPPPASKSQSNEQQRKRTKDIQIDHDVDFSELLLSPPILKGLSEAGYLKPSPIQLKGIPLGRFGVDVIAQAKSGTGKTCVFSVIALEAVSFSNPLPQAIILAPTREIAVQIKEVVNVIGKYCTGLRCEVFIGGMPLATDKQNLKNCQIVVGTPGRIKQLIESLQIRTESIRLFILDEADKLLDPGFQTPLNWIFKALPAKKQVMAFSATYPAALINVLSSYMTNPQHVMLCSDTPSLEGVKQYYQIVPEGTTPYHTFEEKAARLFKILRGVTFHQCVVFCNNRARAQDLSDRLNREGWASAYIAGGQEQQDRNTTMKSLRDFQLRILVSTDLTARGIDIDRVNLVVNIEMPKDLETYLHRIGRTGRFGTFGVAVTFISPSDMPLIDQLCTTYHTQIQELKEGEEIPAEFYKYSIQSETEQSQLTKLVQEESNRQESGQAYVPTNLPKKEKEPETKSTTKKKKEKKATTETSEHATEGQYNYDYYNNNNNNNNNNNYANYNYAYDPNYYDPNYNNQNNNNQNYNNPTYSNQNYNNQNYYHNYNNPNYYNGHYPNNYNYNYYNNTDYTQNQGYNNWDYNNGYYNNINNYQTQQPTTEQQIKKTQHETKKTQNETKKDKKTNGLVIYTKEEAKEKGKKGK